MKFKRLMSAVCCVSAVALMAVACGGDESSECGDSQTYASVNGGPEQCYNKCVDGACAAGFTCAGGLCVVSSSSNTSNNMSNTTNNTSNSTNNTSNTPNSTSNNASNMPNNSMSNNMNSMTCDSALNIGPCEPLCDPTGCAAGEACAIGRSGPNTPLQSICQPAGTVAPGGTCDQMNACQDGSVCIVEDAMATSGTCLEICEPGGAACTQAGATCAAQNNEMTVGFCIVPEDACDPLNDMCPAGEKCALTNLGLQCFPTAGGMAGAACDTSNTSMAPCDKGLVCAQVGQDITCQVLCDPADGSRCTGGTSCMADPNDPTVGICL